MVSSTSHVIVTWPRTATIPSSSSSVFGARRNRLPPDQDRGIVDSEDDELEACIFDPTSAAAADAAASVVLLRDRFSASFLSLKSWYVLCIDTPGRANASRRLAYAYPINRCNRHVSIAFAAWHAHPQSPDRPPDRQTHTVLQSWRFWYTATQMRWSEKRDWSSSSKVTGWFQATSCCTLSPRATSD